MILRPLTNADAGEAAEVIRAAFAAQNRQINPPSSALLETGLSIAAKIAHIARVSVAPEARGRGFVRLLIAACETEARRRGVRRMTFKTRLELPENERLFERCGFARREVEAHPGFETPTTVVMEKVIE
jgi:GNAT superfamily N-acetyltransferase